MLKTFPVPPSKPTLATAASVLVVTMAGCAPKIVSFQPTSGPPGTEVTIEGERFGGTPAENRVAFGTVPVLAGDLVQATSTQIKARVPAGAQTGLITVTRLPGDRSGTSSMNFVVPATGVAKWTMMVYLDADNNLENAGLNDFREMASVGSSPDLNIVVQMDRSPGYSTNDGNWSGSRRFLIRHDDTPAGSPLQDLGNQNMGDPVVLRGFVEWAVESFPAERYALVIWNHGGGWRAPLERAEAKVRTMKAAGQTPAGVVRAIAWDETSGDELYLREVQTALEAARTKQSTAVKLDVVGMDACLMGMVEVAYALRNVAGYVVGSEETEPGDGWPYDTILGDLVATPALAPDRLARAIVKRYGQSYTSGVTQSAVDVTALNGLALAIDAFTVAANGEWDKLRAARLGTRQFHLDGFSTTWGADLRDFAERVRDDQTGSPAVRTAAVGLKDAVERFVIAEHHSPNMDGSHGVAIYFPPGKAIFDNDPEHTGYEQGNTNMPVDFVLHHQWDEWLARYYSNVP